MMMMTTVISSVMWCNFYTKSYLGGLRLLLKAQLCIFLLLHVQIITAKKIILSSILFNMKSFLPFFFPSPVSSTTSLANIIQNAADALLEFTGVHADKVCHQRDGKEASTPRLQSARAGISYLSRSSRRSLAPTSFSQEAVWQPSALVPVGHV